MVLATICIPKQRLQRMRGKTMMNPDENPYESPTLERTCEFRLAHNAILCRKGHEFAKICLVTGRTDYLVRLRIGMAWLPMTAKVIGYSSPLFMLVGPIGFLILNRYFSQSSN